MPLLSLKNHLNNGRYLNQHEFIDSNIKAPATSLNYNL